MWRAWSSGATPSRSCPTSCSATAKNELKLTATDLDMELVETVPGKAKGEGATTVPAHMFHDIVRKLPEGADIELARDGEQGRLAITSGPAQFSLQTLPADDFPGAQRRRSRPQLPHPAADLKRLIDKTRFAISTEETRYYLNGIYLHAAQSGGKPMLRAVATDGHRLAQVELPLPAGAKDMPGVIVPRKTMDELAKLSRTAQARSRIELSPSKIRFALGARGAHLEADRRHLPRLRAGHPARQRQDDGGRQRRLRPGRRPRGDALQRQRPRGEADDRRRQADALGQQPGQRQRHRGAAGRVRLRSAWRSASTPATCSTSRGRSKAAPPSSSSPIPARPPWCATARMPRRSMCSCRCGYEGRIARGARD